MSIRKRKSNSQSVELHSDDHRVYGMGSCKFIAHCKECGHSWKSWAIDPETAVESHKERKRNCKSSNCISSDWVYCEEDYFEIIFNEGDEK